MKAVLEEGALKGRLLLEFKCLGKVWLDSETVHGRPGLCQHSNGGNYQGFGHGKYCHGSMRNHRHACSLVSL